MRFLEINPKISYWAFNSEKTITLTTNTYAQQQGCCSTYYQLKSNHYTS